MISMLKYTKFWLWLFPAFIFCTYCYRYKYNTIDDPRYNLGPPDHRDLMMLTYFMSTLACAYTSLPSRLKNEPLGHPVAHLLDCIPYQVPVTVPSKQQDKCGNVNEQKNVILSSSVSTFDVQHDTLEIDSLYTNKNDSNLLAFRIMRPDSNLFAENFAFPSSVDSLLACLNATLVALCVVPQHNVSSAYINTSVIYDIIYLCFDY